jgi:type VI secretion system protein ImpL
MPIYLKHVEGSKAGQLESLDQDLIRLGRQSDNDIRFDPQKDLAVSGYHAEIYRDGDVYYIKDLQSRNGTYVNSRKIEQAVLLKESDVVQFSLRGPKMVISLRDPALGSETAVLAPDAATRTIVSPDEEKATAEIKSTKPAYLQPKVLIAAALVGLAAVLLGIGLYLGYSWWALLIGSAAVSLIAGGGYLAWRLWKRRQALREQKETARGEREASLGLGDKDTVQDLRRKWAEVIRSLRASNLQRPGDDAVYALPWYMLLGESGSGKSALVKAAGPLNAIRSRGEDGPTANCDWWFFDKTVVLDTSGRFAYQSKNTQSPGEWRELLNLLNSHRRLEPINGVIVAVAADSLVSRPVDKLKEQAALLRERLDEMVHQLGVKYPVYLAITKCDLIAGFNEYFQILPDQVKSQALGHVNSSAVNNADASRFFDKAFATLCERAERVRLALILDEQRDEATRQMFLFPAELRCLQLPMKAFVDVLFRPSPYQDAPFFRGIFLASARQTGSPLSRLSRLLGVQYVQMPNGKTNRDLFLRDLFSVILPGDRALAGRTALGRERYQLTHAAGLIAAIAASFLLCGLLTLSFTNNWFALKRLDIAPCIGLGGSGGTVVQVLRPLDECRESIDGLIPHSLWKRIALNFGLGQTRHVGAALQQRFLTGFRAGVLNPLDTRIDQSLASGAAGSMMVGAVIQRIQLLARCQESGQCVDLDKSDGAGYGVMLAAIAPQIKDSDPAIERLRRTQEAFLHWQTDPKSYSEMYTKDVERVRRWLVAGGLKGELVLESAKAQFPPIRVADFLGVHASIQVEAAYTGRAWREGINPLFSGLQQMTSESTDVRESVKAFEANYRDQALHQWGEFLTRFPEAEKTAFQKGIRELALNVVGADSAYERVIQSAHDNLSQMLGSAWQGTNLPAWAITLKQYVALKQKVAQAKSVKPSSEEKGQTKEAEAMGYLAAYQDALSQLRTELSTTEKSFKSAQKAFEEGEPSNKAVHPILKASWALTMLRELIGSPQQEDRLFWILLARPSAIAWRAMLEESGKHLQSQWEGLLLEVKLLEPGPRGGKIIGFVNGSAAAFLSRQGARWVPRRLLEQNLPFTDAFLQYLSRLRLDAMAPSTVQPSSAPEPPFNIARIS